MLDCDEYLMPVTLDEALVLWGGAPEASRIVAGATDILPWAREGRAGDVHVPRIIDISRVSELKGYEIRDGRVRIGAMVAMQAFLSEPELRRHLPCMPYCAVWFADDQIREQATLVGNVVNASPAADGIPPLVAMNADVEIATLVDGAVCRRSVPIGDFVTGPGRTSLGQGEMVTAVICDAMSGYGGAFEKVGQRRSLVISVVCAAALVKASADGERFKDVRLALGGIGPVPVRLDKVEQFLIGTKISSSAVVRASQFVDGLVQSRTRQAYRTAVTSGFIDRALADALGDIGIVVDGGDVEERSHV